MESKGNDCDMSDEGCVILELDLDCIELLSQQDQMTDSNGKSNLVVLLLNESFELREDLLSSKIVIDKELAKENDKSYLPLCTNSPVIEKIQSDVINIETDVIDNSCKQVLVSTSDTMDNNKISDKDKTEYCNVNEGNSQLLGTLLDLSITYKKETTVKTLKLENDNLVNVNISDDSKVFDNEVSKPLEIEELDMRKNPFCDVTNIDHKSVPKSIDKYLIWSNDNFIKKDNTKVIKVKTPSVISGSEWQKVVKS